ncbi:MAG: sigma-54-dependent Fis family transcriptional regulator [Deltaproteobacteria bacterium]|nr:sigma-54-dependent Fis family transcriptional regulator [Deltaproteobacteria bacterium]
MANILIIDDDRMLCDMLCRQIERMGHKAEYANDIAEGIKKAASAHYAVVYLDVNLPDGNGLDALPEIKALSSSPEVIIFTAEGDPNGAELAINSGAWDYIEKPLAAREMMLPLARALQYREEKAKKKPRAALKREHIIGSSPQLQDSLDLLAEAATDEENVLLIGETGTGKELIARAIHENSGRAAKNFVVVDCTALPGNLVESMLFGHEKGAFTGAEKAHIGLIKQADGGTLFLDEVGELSFPLQKSFLRVLQEHRFRPLGSQTELESDFRLVAATNRSLDLMVEKNDFRQDLLYRLKSLMIQLPPLKDRAGDVKEIAVHYIQQTSENSGTEMKGFSPEFFEALERYDWPGNIRELLSTLERVLVTSKDEPILFARHLPTHIRVHLAQSLIDRDSVAHPAAAAGGEKKRTLPLLKDYRQDAMAEVERGYLTELMLSAGNNIKEACRVSGLSQSRLYHLLKKYHISHS